MVHAGRIWNPEVLADLAGQTEGGKLIACEDQLGAHDHLIVTEFNQLLVGKSGSEPTLFIEFLIVGDVDLRDNSEDLSGRCNDGAVVQFTSQFYRCTEYYDHVSGDI